MTLALQALPLVLLLLLLGTGRAGPVAACLVALAAAVPAAAVSLPDPPASLAGLLAGEALRGAWLALQPIGVVTGGLLFHAAVSAGGEHAAPRPASAAMVFAVTLPLGAFLESVTGFAIGAVFALTALRGMGLGGPVAVALALQALVLVPWGGLGPGTALGAALVGQPAQGLAQLGAWPSAAWLLLLAPLIWSLMRRAGLALSGRERAAQLAMLAAVAGLLLLGNHLLPFEVVGIVATAPVLAVALWRADPSRDLRANPSRDLRAIPSRDLRAAARAAAPYLLLTLSLLGARLWQAPPALHPFAGLPGMPITHVAVVLWLVAAALLLRLPDGGARAAAALRRAARPALAMLLYVVLGRILAGGGIAAGLAVAAAAALGPLAPFAIPPLGLLAGMVTGSNVGANAALAPLQAQLGAATGLPPLLGPGVHNFAGAAGAGMSVGVTAMTCALLGDGTRPAQVWRLLWPSMLMVIGLGAATIAVLR
jgi:lactate permease